jgi:dimethylamine/trimethylamine dehydrogenase
LSAARGLGLRGYEVTLAEAGVELGGRVQRERKLPGLSAWGRVADYRAGQIAKMANVSVYFDSRLSAEDVLAMDFDHVAIATGSNWRRDAVARHHTLPIPIAGEAKVFTPDDLMAGNLPSGRVLLYDDDHYYMGGVLAELLVRNGNAVTLVTPSSRVSDWTWNTLEQTTIQRRMIEFGIDIRLTHALVALNGQKAEIACVYSGRRLEVACDAALLVTARLPQDGLYRDLENRAGEWRAAGLKTVKRIGDADAPAPIAWATYAGHRYAEELEEPDIGDRLAFKREVAGLKG